MSITLESAARLAALRDKADAVTGESSDTLAGAVDALIAGYGQGGGGSEDFVGIKYSNFDSNRGSPKTADARSLPENTSSSQYKNGGYTFLFASASKNFNGGWHSMLEEVYLPKLYIIAGNMFQNCGSLKRIYGDLSGVVRIAGAAFTNCQNLTEIPYMPNLTTVDGNAFNGCTGLKEVKLYSKPDSIGNNAFNGCTNITDIYVSWAEGEVANAPWGATNATIHYNTTYDENHNPIV